MTQLIQYISKGLYCKEGDFYIDPNSSVEKAFITHAHADHAKRGCKEYFCAKQLEEILRHRIGKKAKITTLAYGKKIKINNTIISLHPAGHMLGSAQVRVENNNEVWVVSGDYKRDDDPTCEPFEVVPCNVFITEATFANPNYEWRPTSEVIKEIVSWWRKNKKENTSSILLCYSLGKAQRILGELRNHLGKKEQVHIHSSIEPYVKYYENAGIKLVKTKTIESADEKELRKALVIAPPSLKNLEWYEKFPKYKTGFASGWMHRYNPFTRSVYDAAFPISDHADWPGLLRTIKETGAKKVYVMHGPEKELIRHLKLEGIEAHPIENYIPFKERMKKGQLTLKHFFSAQ